MGLFSIMFVILCQVDIESEKIFQGHPLPGLCLVSQVVESHITRTAPFYLPFFAFAFIVVGLIQT